MPGEFFAEDILHLTGDEVFTSDDRRRLIVGTLPQLIAAGYGTEKSIAFYRDAFQRANQPSIRDSVFRDIYRTVRDRMIDPDNPDKFRSIDPFSAIPDTAIPTTTAKITNNFRYWADVYNYNPRTGQIEVSSFGIYSQTLIASPREQSSQFFQTITERPPKIDTLSRVVAVVPRGIVRRVS